MPAAALPVSATQETLPADIRKPHGVLPATLDTGFDAQPADRIANGEVSIGSSAANCDFAARE